MAVSNVVKVRKDGTITIADGAGSPLTFTVDYENGDFSGSWPKRDSTVIRDRGSIAGERQADQQLGQLSFSVHMREFANVGAATIVDVIERTNTWSAATSTGGTGYESFMHKVTLGVEGTDHTDSADHAWVFSKVKLNWSFSEGDPNVINVTGEVYAAPTRTGALS